MKRITRRLFGLMVTVLFGVIVSPTAQASEFAVDMDDFDLEWTASQVSYTSFSDEDGYKIHMSLEGQHGFLFGMYRHDLDWEGQGGITLSLKNESNDSMLLALHLVDENWESIALPDGAAVLLQEDMRLGYIVVFASDSTVVVPAGFHGKMMIPLDVSVCDLSQLGGFGLTFIPLDEAEVTLESFSFWEDEITQLRDSLGSTQLELQDHYICLPEVGEAMTVATVTGVSPTQEVEYSLVNPPLGATIDQKGRIIIDDTVKVSELVVKAMVDQQVSLKTTLFLYSVWDVLPDDVAIEDFTIMEQTRYENTENYSGLTLISDYITVIQVFCGLVGLGLFLTYVLWRGASRKP